MIKQRLHLSKILLMWSLFLLYGNWLNGQADANQKRAQFKDPVSRLWVNTYGKIRFTDKLAWIAQTHFRFQEKDDMPFAGQIAQLYNRHAINYTFSKKFNASLGGVLRLNFNTDEIPENERPMVPEFRIWHEYLFCVPLSRIKISHRIRLEHRWSKGFKGNDDYIFRNRWRYMFNMKVPLNKPKFVPGTFYVAPEAELILQSGKTVVNSPMEDLRLHTSFGYMINEELVIATGLMYSMGQQLGQGDIFHQKYTVRAHVYFCPDWSKKE